MTERLKKHLKAGVQEKLQEKSRGIFSYLNPAYLEGDNQKYMTMYDKMAPWYDFGEKWIGKIKYGNSIARLRTHLMEQLEWEDGLSVLYVSIGTGSDLHYLPKKIDKASLDFVGVDISLGMLERCRKTWSKKMNLSLVQACAEDLPFADNSFDLVLHVGGINFFSDQGKALDEMVRVAKPGTKILVADETADYVDSQYKKNALSKQYFEDATVNIKELEALLPSQVTDKELEFIWDNRFYALTFRKRMALQEEGRAD